MTTRQATKEEISRYVRWRVNAAMIAATDKTREVLGDEHARQ